MKQLDIYNQTYCLVSDIHLHNWSTFATTDPADGVNTRLRGTLQELQRAAVILRMEYDGNLLVCAGDLFHVRGHLSPSMLNPVLETFQRLREAGFTFLCIPGNHDLESRDAHRLTSAITTLEGAGVKAINDPCCWQHGLIQLAFIPWFTSASQVMAEAKNLRERLSTPSSVDLILHAPLDGVLPWLPNHGLTPTALAELGFRRVFCGHYHHHRDFGNGVYSIGALNHQTWNDVNSEGGFLIVTPEAVHKYESKLPRFVDLSGMPPAEWATAAKSNYVRIRANLSPEESDAVKKQLSDYGALGASVQPLNQSARTRTSSAVSAGASLEESIRAFIAQQQYEHTEPLTTLCLDILREVRPNE